VKCRLQQEGLAWCVDYSFYVVFSQLIWFKVTDYEVDFF